MRTTVLAVAALACGVAAQAQEPVHLIAPGTTFRSFVAPATLNDRLRAAATEYRRYAPVPRISLFDLAFPSSPTEYRAVGGYAVLLITAMSQDSAELPLARVYVNDGTHVEALLVLSSVLSVTDSSLGEVRHTLGRYRFDALYSIPVQSIVRPGQLVIDYARHRSGFVIHEFTGEVPEMIRDLPIGRPAAAPDTVALNLLIQREYPGFLRP
jgi:hypothetical protein